jgi:hypothetical protein
VLKLSSNEAEPMLIDSTTSKMMGKAPDHIQAGSYQEKSEVRDQFCIYNRTGTRWINELNVFCFCRKPKQLNLQSQPLIAPRTHGKYVPSDKDWLQAHLQNQQKEQQRVPPAFPIARRANSLSAKLTKKGSVKRTQTVRKQLQDNGDVNAGAALAIVIEEALKSLEGVEGMKEVEKNMAIKEVEQSKGAEAKEEQSAVSGSSSKPRQLGGKSDEPLSKENSLSNSSTAGSLQRVDSVTRKKIQITKVHRSPMPPDSPLSPLILAASATNNVMPKMLPMRASSMTAASIASRPSKVQMTPAHAMDAVPFVQEQPSITVTMPSSSIVTPGDSVPQAAEPTMDSILSSKQDVPAKVEQITEGELSSIKISMAPPHPNTQQFAAETLPATEFSSGNQPSSVIELSDSDNEWEDEPAEDQSNGESSGAMLEAIGTRGILGMFGFKNPFGVTTTQPQDTPKGALAGPAAPFAQLGWSPQQTSKLSGSEESAQASEGTNLQEGMGTVISPPSPQAPSVLALHGLGEGIQVLDTITVEYTSTAVEELHDGGEVVAKEEVITPRIVAKEAGDMENVNYDTNQNTNQHLSPTFAAHQLLPNPNRGSVASMGTVTLILVAAPSPQIVATTSPLANEDQFDDFDDDGMAREGSFIETRREKRGVKFPWKSNAFGRRLKLGGMKPNKSNREDNGEHYHEGTVDGLEGTESGPERKRVFADKSANMWKKLTKAKWGGGLLKSKQQASGQQPDYSNGIPIAELETMGMYMNNSTILNPYPMTTPNYSEPTQQDPAGLISHVTQITEVEKPLPPPPQLMSSPPNLAATPSVISETSLNSLSNSSKSSASLPFSRRQSSLAAGTLSIRLATGQATQQAPSMAISTSPIAAPQITSPIAPVGPNGINSVSPIMITPRMTSRNLFGTPGNSTGTLMKPLAPPMAEKPAEMKVGSTEVGSSSANREIKQLNITSSMSAAESTSSNGPIDNNPRVSISIPSRSSSKDIDVSSPLSSLSSAAGSPLSGTPTRIAHALGVPRRKSLDISPLSPSSGTVDMVC